MHGLGNDFIIVDARNNECELNPGRIQQLCDRKNGIGCDQFIVLHPPKEKGANITMQILNADGSESEACGNATRCVADLIMKEKGANECMIQTLAGLLKCHIADKGLITVDMGVPSLKWDKIPLAQDCDTRAVPLMEPDLPPGVAVNIGNPHCVFFIDEPVDDYAVNIVGPKIEHDPIFPNRTNVEFCNVLDRKTIRMRVWERGVGETNACGSGACAVAVAAIERNLADRHCTVVLNGGDLHFHWREEDDHILMTGPVSYVFKGTVI